jgi:AcrR family transcriptional regulator
MREQKRQTKLEKAKAEWVKSPGEVSAADIAAAVGISVRSLHKHLGPRAEARERWAGGRRMPDSAQAAQRRRPGEDWFTWIVRSEGRGRKCRSSADGSQGRGPHSIYLRELSIMTDTQTALPRPPLVVTDLPLLDIPLAELRAAWDRKRRIAGRASLLPTETSDV